MIDVHQHLWPDQFVAALGRRSTPPYLDGVELVLHEGRNRQVKRMLEAVGHPVTHLHRSVYAGLTLEGLEPGAWRELEPSEVASISRRGAQPGR